MNLAELAGLLPQAETLGQVGPTRSPTSDPEVPVWVWIVYFTQIGLSLAFLFGSVLYGAFYWKRNIQPTQEKRARPGIVVPPSLHGDWQHTLCGAWCHSCGTCFTTCCCSICVQAEMWYRAGWTHAIMGETQESCQAYYLSLLLYVFLSSLVGSCMPCVLAFGRGGLDTGPGGEEGIVPFDSRFRMQLNYVSSCCIMCYCLPCATSQMYLQMMDLLDHPETTVVPPQPMMMMVPPQMGHAPQQASGAYQQPIEGQVMPQQQPMMGYNNQPIAIVGQPVQAQMPATMG